MNTESIQYTDTGSAKLATFTSLNLAARRCIAKSLAWVAVKHSQTRSGKTGDQYSQPENPGSLKSLSVIEKQRLGLHNYMD